MSKRFKKIVQDVTNRWKETISSTAEPDVAGATKLLNKALNRPRIFTARSPLEFYIAQAVLRGRVAKKSAVEMAEKYGIDPAFVKPLTRVGGPQLVIETWGRWRATQRTTNMLTATLENQFEHNTNKVSQTELRKGDALQGRAQVQLQDLHWLYGKFLPFPNSAFMSKSEVDYASKRNWLLNFAGRPGRILGSSFSIFDAINERAGDLAAGQFEPSWHQNDGVSSEIICRALGCKDPEVIWQHELFHYVPGFMLFKDAILLLTGKPKFELNSDGAFHNAAGPAVVWPDGKKFWYIDGHELAQFGEEIVLRPESLTKEQINKIANEEERRVAIERMGWNKYLAVIGAQIQDSRVNAVDNTYEVLISPPSQKGTPWTVREPMRMVLSCRSTGRKYFIAVPKEIPNAALTGFAWISPADREMYPDQKVTTCEAAQKWLADGATTPHLDYAKYPIRIIGAS